MARDADIERRLQNWGRWRASMGSTVGNFSGVDLTEERVDGGGYDAPMVVPILEAEAQVTEAAVQALEPGHCAAVHAVYVAGGSMEKKAQRLGVSVPTVYARIDLAHRRISVWLAERATAQREQRYRVEALQAAARPPDVDIGPKKKTPGLLPLRGNR